MAENRIIFSRWSNVFQKTHKTSLFNHSVPQPNSLNPVQTKRLLSLDALRGFDMLFIMGLSELIVAVCGLFPGGQEGLLARNMGHAAWHGLYFQDTIFPLFLFIAGISFPFSYAKQRSAGASRRTVCLKIFRRAALLVLFGLIYNGLFNLDFSRLRVASVLGRIGTAWMFAALLYVFCSRKMRIATAAVILIGYWLALWLIPSGPDPFSFENNLVGRIDRVLLPGRLYEGSFDPEGLFSTLPAIVTALLGMFTGEFVRSERRTGTQKTLYMLLAAVLMLCAGLLWGQIFPINKKLWTSSFVLVAGAYSLAMFALFYYLADVRGFTVWTFPLRVVGMNSITIYMAQVFIGFRGISHFFLGGLARLAGGPWENFILTAGYLLACWLFLYFLYRKKVFLKV